MDKFALINAISRYCPGDLPDRFKHFGHYRGGMGEETEWYTSVLSEASEDDLKKCLDLMQINASFRVKALATKQN